MTQPEPDRNRPDLARLAAWMGVHLPALGAPVAAHPLAGGQSNPTYRLEGADGGACVLRRKPPGPLLPSAHQVEREYRVLAALGATDVPVPRVLALCEDTSVIGSVFYVMEFVPGRVFFDPRLPGLSPAERHAIFGSMNDTIARLHRVDPAAVGLDDFGRPAAYMARQVKRWTQQYRHSETTRIAAMDRLIEWLPAHLVDSGESRIVHGDLRLDNMLIHPTEPRVVAVLDWELSTLGDPLADFANNTLAWHLEPDLFRGLAGEDLAALGIPSEAEYVAEYHRRVGKRRAPAWEVYLVFALFRLAAILQGIVGRARDGTASDPQAPALAAKVAPMAEKGWALARHL